MTMQIIRDLSYSCLLMYLRGRAAMALRLSHLGLRMQDWADRIDNRTDELCERYGVEEHPPEFEAFAD